MKAERLHRIDWAKGQDQVSAHWTTACGVAGRSYLGKEVFPKDAGDALVCEGEKVWLAKNYSAITCPKCRVRLTPAQKKIVRAMLDHGPADVREGPRVEWKTDGAFALWAPPDSIMALRRLRLVAIVTIGKKAILTGNGRLLAAALPKPKDPFA